MSTGLRTDARAGTGRLPSAPAAAATVPTGPRGRVLVVDDDPGTRTVVSRVLEVHGFLAEVSDSLPAARIRLRQSSYDILLVDLRLGDDSGLSLLDEIKPLAPYTVAIVLTGLQGVDIALDALRRGAYDYIRKPFSGDTLLLAIERCMRHRQLQLDYDRHRVQLERLLEQHVQERNLLARRLANTQTMVFRVAGVVAESAAVGGVSHLTRVGVFARELATSLPGWYCEHHGIGDSFPERLAEAAYLHDIGHVNLPDKIVNKPGALAEHEAATVRRHPIVGHEFLQLMRECVDVSGAPTLDLAMEVCLTHHERLDGSGYPNRLTGDQVPIAARIVGVVDSYDAMTSWRAYRPGRLTHEEALAQVRSERGTAFDPVVVDAFLAAGERLLLVRSQFPESEPDAVAPPPMPQAVAPS